MNQIKGNIKIGGQIRLTCYDKNGKLKWDSGWIKNDIVNAGLAELPNLVGGVAAASVFKFLAVGTNSTAVAATNTTLGTELTDKGLARAEATPTRVTTTVTNDTLQLYKEWTVTGTATVEEVGIFNTSSGGTMLGRALTTSKAVISDDKLQGTYKIRFK